MYDSSIQIYFWFLSSMINASQVRNSLLPLISWLSIKSALLIFIAFHVSSNCIKKIFLTTVLPAKEFTDLAPFTHRPSTLSIHFPILQNSLFSTLLLYWNQCNKLASCCDDVSYLPFGRQPSPASMDFPSSLIFSTEGREMTTVSLVPICSCWTDTVNTSLMARFFQNVNNVVHYSSCLGMEFLIL